jgi:hypothetical protein
VAGIVHIRLGSSLLHCRRPDARIFHAGIKHSKFFSRQGFEVRTHVLLVEVRRSNLSASAGVPLIPDVLTVAGFPAFVGIPGVVVFSDVAFIPAVAGVSAVAVGPAVDGVFAVASFPSNPGVPM